MIMIALITSVVGSGCLAVSLVATGVGTGVCISLALVWSVYTAARILANTARVLFLMTVITFAYSVSALFHIMYTTIALALIGLLFLVNVLIAVICCRVKVPKYL